MQTITSFLTRISTLVLFAGGPFLNANISTLADWALIEDPAHPGFSASTPTATTALLQASNLPVPTATDIGFKSVDGMTVADSSSGYAFNPSSDFAVAIDFDLSFAGSPAGGLGIGFGIGEDANGENSAGGALFTNNGAPLSVGSVARTANINQTGQGSLFFGSAGSINVSYFADSGNVTISFSDVGSSTTFFTDTFAGIQNDWNDNSLLVSFFLRSDDQLGSAWTGGEADVVFSEMRVLSGTPTAVPEPAAFTLLTLTASACFLLLRRRNAVKRN